MNKKITIINIIILLLEHPLHVLFKGNLKKSYSKELKKKIEKLKLKKNQEFSIFITEIDELHKIIDKFILSNQQELSDEQQFFLKELDNCLLQIKNNTLSSHYELFHEISFSFILEKLKQKQSLSLNEDLPLDIKKNTQDWEHKAKEATQYGYDLNLELEHIAGDITNLLKTIKTLKAKLTLEESRSEILIEEKEVLTKELALEKEKKNIKK